MDFLAFVNDVARALDAATNTTIASAVITRYCGGLETVFAEADAAEACRLVAQMMLPEHAVPPQLPAVSGESVARALLLVIEDMETDGVRTEPSGPATWSADIDRQTALDIVFSEWLALAFRAAAERVDRLFFAWGSHMANPDAICRIAEFLRGRPEADQTQIAGALVREAAAQVVGEAAPLLGPPRTREKTVLHWGRVMIQPRNIMVVADALANCTVKERERLLRRFRAYVATSQMPLNPDTFAEIVREAVAN